VPTLPLSNHDIQDEDDRGWNADADRQHIAACDPSFMLRVYDGHLGVLDRHARSVFDETELYDICVCKEDHDGDCSPIVHDICVPCSCGQEKGLGCREVAWPCPEIAAVVVLYRPVPESVTSGGETP
jgi:hypothetical protein